MIERSTLGHCFWYALKYWYAHSQEYFKCALWALAYDLFVDPKRVRAFFDNLNFDIGEAAAIGL